MDATQLPAQLLSFTESGLGRFVGGALVILLTAIVTTIVLRIATHALRKLMENSPVGEVSIVLNIVRGLLIFIAMYFVGQNVFGLEMGGLIQALGVTTLVVSLGLQDFIKNVVAGMEVVGTKLLSVGDHIQVGDVRGEVSDINWRQVVVRDKDNNANIIPNSTLMGGAFTRLEGTMAQRYLFECKIKQGLDLPRVAADIEQLADAAVTAGGWNAEGLSTQVRFLGSTPEGVIASVRLYLSDVAYTTPAIDAVLRAICQRGYLADWTNDSPVQDDWR